MDIPFKKILNKPMVYESGLSKILIFTYFIPTPGDTNRKHVSNGYDICEELTNSLNDKNVP